MFIVLALHVRCSVLPLCLHRAVRRTHHTGPRHAMDSGIWSSSGSCHSPASAAAIGRVTWRQQALVLLPLERLAEQREQARAGHDGHLAGQRGCDGRSAPLLAARSRPRCRSRARSPRAVRLARVEVRPRQHVLCQTILERELPTL